jgi:hypothetical protein
MVSLWAVHAQAQLNLSFVFGYGGLSNTAPNVFLTESGEVVYYTAAVGVVYCRATHTQRFFTRHTDDIRCLALCDAPVTYAGVHYPPRTLVATGQVRRHCQPWSPTSSVLRWMERYGVGGE